MGNILGRADAADLPDGVRIRQLVRHGDSRGGFVEIFRDEWETGCLPKQWNAVQSDAGVMRGVHVHVDHVDYLTVAAGSLLLGLHDLRRDSATSGLSCLVEIVASQPRAIAIPPGVCHGFYFAVPSIHIYAVSEYWNPEDEFGCRFDSPALGLDWPDGAPLLSPRDRDAGSLEVMREAYEAACARRRS